MFNSHQLHRFAIRKYAVGVCSVMVASFMFLGATLVSADQLETAAEVGTEQVADSPTLSQSQKVQTEPAELEATQAHQVLANEPVATPATETVIAPTTEPSSPQLLDQVKEPQETKPETVQPASVPATQSVSVAEASKPAEQSVAEFAPAVEEQPVLTSTGEKATVDSATIAKDVSEPQAIPTTSKPEPSPLPTKIVPAKFTRGTGFRSFGMTRSATPSGVIGDDYPAKWKAVRYEDDVVDEWRTYARNCTSFAAYRLQAINGYNDLPKPPGNANEWGYRARVNGILVDNSPVRGAIAWSDATPNNSAGHVAWVAAVQGDMVTVEEYNIRFDGTYNSRTVHKSAFTGYIHYKDLGHRAVATPPTTTAHGLPAQGTYTFTQRTGVKNEPTMASPDRATYDVGESVNYDKVLENDNHVWLSYINFSGSRSYVAVKVLPPQAPPQVSTITSPHALPSQGTYTFTQRVGVKDQPSMSSPERTFYQPGASVRYDQVLEKENHVWISYINYSGSRSYIAVKVLTPAPVPQPTPAPAPLPKPVPTPRPTLNLPAQGTYKFTKTLPIKNQANMSSATIDYYYAGETVNYDRVLTSEGRQWLSYMSRSGLRRYVPLT